MNTDDKKIVNKPETEIDQKPLTIEHIESRNHHTPEERLTEIEKEFKNGFDFIKKYQKSVSFYGSARFKEDSVHYQQARDIAFRIVKELNCAIVTGGGPGIMEAGNRGAREAGGDSLGFTITLPHEQVSNPYTTDSIEFYYFFIRKVMLSFAAEAYLFFPGGFGTLDEFFEIATLVQTNKVPKLPIILVGKDFWEPIRGVIRQNLYKDHQAIDESDMDLFTITEDVDQIVEIIKKAPMRKN